MRIQTPDKLKPLWEHHKYKIVYGGRGSGKSWGVGDYLIVSSLNEQEGGTYLCAREYQTSIADSVYPLLVDKIHNYNLNKYFTINKNEIISKPSGIRFAFSGLRRDPHGMKSMYKLKKVWVEEAQSISKDSMTILLPTIREDDSELIFTYNPQSEDDPVYQLTIDPYPDTLLVNINWRDNPWFTERMKEQMEKDREKDYDLYLHVWEGKTYSRSEAQVLWDKCKIEEFTPLANWNGPYYGIDWGFSNDPMRMVRVWVADNKLWIEKEVNGLRVDINKIPFVLKNGDPHCHKYTARADNSRPETISYVQQHGLPKVVACRKGAGSVEEGISFIRSFDEIVINPSCKHTIEEARLYSYKIDKMSGDILPDIVDAYNHSWDAVRYALEPLIPSASPGSVKVRRR